jgi:hypothetical protein
MSFTVTLTDDDLNICRILGNLRTLISRGNGIKDAKVADASGLDLDEDGLIGELAFCKHFNVFFDPTMYNRSGSADCVYNGHKIDVKSTRYSTGRLLATLKKATVDDVSIYVLAIIDGRKVHFPGWAYAHELCKEENIKDLGRGKGYALDQNQLRPWKNHD